MARLGVSLEGGTAPRSLWLLTAEFALLGEDSVPAGNRNRQARRLISVHPLPRAARPRLLLRAVVALPAVLALTLVAVLSGCGAGTTASGTAVTSDTVPPFYAETIAIQPPAYDSPLNVSIRATATGDESAALRALPPYQSIGFVAGTGKPNWWIVGAQRWHPVNYDNSAQPAKLYLATRETRTIDGNPFNDAMLTPLPVAPMRASQLMDGTAESSGVRQLAAATVSPTESASRWSSRRETPIRSASTP